MLRTEQEHAASRHMAARVQTIEAAVEEADNMLTVLARDFVPRVSDDLRVTMTELVNEAQANLAIARRAIMGEG